MRWPWTHRCRFEPVDVQRCQLAVSPFSTTKIEATVVLLRCECGNTSTQSFPGTWTLDQVRGKSLGDAIERMTR